MKNIYDERKEENLLFILDSDGKKDTAERTGMNCAVIVYLYYMNTVSGYIHYIDNIPNGIPAYIYSSNAAVLEQVKVNARKKDIFFYLKENRGRDISALLVAAADVVKQYDYICFVHDKSANEDYLREDVEMWTTNLWENTLSSEEYIRKVLDIFENRKDLGLLAPPEPYGKYTPIWYGDTWRKDFQLTRQVAQELEIDADINREKEVFALGTVFWSRTEALKGLYKKEWKYTDFPCEPLAKDGTVSHAIERIFCYTAQDAGYKTGTIMTERYAEWLLLNVQEDMRMMFYQMKKRHHVHNMAQVQNLDRFESVLKEFADKYPQIYIFGAGDYGTELYRFFEDRSWTCEGFIVSDGKRKELSVLGKKVWEISELSQSDKIGIAIGVSYEFRDEVEHILSAHGFRNYIYAY